MSEFQHDPAHCDHLGDGAHLARPVGFDGDFFVNPVENQDSPNDFEIPGDDESNEPNGEMPIDPPVHESGGHEAGHEEGLVGEGIKDGSGERLLIEVSGNPAIESVENRSKSVNRNGEPAEGFVRQICIDRSTIAHSSPGKDRNEGESNQGDDSGESHVAIPF